VYGSSLKAADTVRVKLVAKKETTVSDEDMEKLKVNYEESHEAESINWKKEVGYNGGPS